MARIFFFIVVLWLWMPAWAQGAPAGSSFALGADISGVTMDESRGRHFYNRNGRQRECTALMRELGMNMIRLRVWVHPRHGFCSKDDMLTLARRAHDLGMDIMVDFHYSDDWADPAHQITPAAWQGISYKALRDSVASHTRETMQLLHDNGITPAWVQIGNETRRGFLWPTGDLDLDMASYADLNNAGYDAVKAVFPQTVCIVHIDNGYDTALYNRIFDGLQRYGGRYDMIGMSLYPYWAAQNDSTLTEERITAMCMSNIQNMYLRYGKESMIVETGYEARRPDDGYRFLSRLIGAARANPHCRGVIYWAPETNDDAQYPLGAFSHDRPTRALDAFSNQSDNPKP